MSDFQEGLRGLSIGGAPEGELYFPSTALSDVIYLCQKFGKYIVGIEGFRRQGGSLIPATEAIADFSSLVGLGDEVISLESIKAAKVFLATCDTTDISVWTFVIFDEDENDDV